MPPYTIDRTSNRGRQEVEDWLFGLDQVSAKLRDDIVTAWGRRLMQKARGCNGDNRLRRRHLP